MTAVQPRAILVTVGKDSRKGAVRKAMRRRFTRLEILLFESLDGIIPYALRWVVADEPTMALSASYALWLA